MPTKLILTCGLSPGDIVTMTAAVRDLHAAYPGEYLTDVRTPCPALWEHNPHITRIEDGDSEARVIPMEYPLIHRSNQTAVHFLDGYREWLSDKLERPIARGAFKGDIHLSAEERGWKSQVEEINGDGARFWIIVAGGKRDFTAKLWETARWQAVVDALAGRVVFVQVGEKGHDHPALRGVVDLRGKTDLRQLVRLVYHSDGVLCGVTSLMHLAAAVPWKHGGGRRPCVVVAGGREPVQWEAYPGHQFLHTIGQLPCCDSGGCWKSRVAPLGDGEKHDASLCVRPVKVAGGGHIPECLNRITAADVLRAVDGYLMPAPAESTVPMPKKPCGGCIQTTKNAVKALGRVVGAALAGDEWLVDDDTRKARLAECVKCEHFEKATAKSMPRCLECGCFVKLKARLATEWCPVGKWGGSKPERRREYGHVGLVIGTFAAVPYVHLQLESLRRFHPGTPCLVVDDGSPQREALAALCARYGAEFIGREKRMNHARGDMQAFVEGHAWAERRGINMLVKLSRRWVPVAPWIEDAARLWMDTGAPTLCNISTAHGFGFRSECVAMDVAAWKKADALKVVRAHIDRSQSQPGDLDVGASGMLVEHIVHMAAAAAKEHAQWKAELNFEPWPWMGTSRHGGIKGVLWHESNPTAHYLEQLHAWGIGQYTMNELVNPKENIHLNR